MQLSRNKLIVLASASPRRNDLLKTLGIPFEVIQPDLDENIAGKPFTRDVIERIALDKALNVKKKIKCPAIIIAADTVVVIGNMVLGKPRDKEEAVRMLRSLSGKTHQVITAVAIADNEINKSITDSVVSNVTFRELSDSEIINYINTGEPMDKAGAYGIQGKASIFISSISGCYSNIVGLPLFKLAQMLKEFGIEVL